MLAPRLFLLIALLATLVVLGVWDGQRQVEHVLEQGYSATARIAGAQYQRKMPLALDGWRPRLVEQELSVDLKWQGRDGKEHEHKQVPVSESFARTIVSGEEVRLMPVGIKALDDDTSVPVIVVDAAHRLASLDSWRTISGVVSLVAWAGFAGLTFWHRRRSHTAGGGGIAKTPSLRDLPPLRTIAGIALLLAGGALAYWAWNAKQSAENARSSGVEVTAEILSESSLASGHAVLLAWKDAQGAVIHFGPVPISEAFHERITRNGQLSVHQTQVRYRPDEPQTRPTILADIADPGGWSTVGQGAGTVLILIGLGCLVSAIRAAGRSAGA